ncbi:MAG: NAD(P)-binding domain-containing protein [Methanomassiliicoccales archaeon]|nr:NAD(P)-binding domain-containing protein [Methanomassiliicoccales archaeon]
MKVGFIGLGNMGAALAAGLLVHRGLRSDQVVLFNRSPAKAVAFRDRFPGAEVAGSSAEIAARSDIIFVSVPTTQVLNVLRELAPLSHRAHLVVTNGGLTVDQMERLCQGAVSKLVPSVTMEVGRGVSLLCHGRSVPLEASKTLEGLLAKASAVKLISEGQFNAATELTSCGPALMAEMMEQFCAAGVRHGPLDAQEAWGMVLETLMGTALLLEKGISVPDLKERVATKGGITEQGLKILESELPAVFDHMMAKTIAKHASVKKGLADRLDD